MCTRICVCPKESVNVCKRARERENLCVSVAVYVCARMCVCVRVRVCVGVCTRVGRECRVVRASRQLLRG